MLKWALSVEEARSIFLEVSTALDSAGAPDKAQVFLVKVRPMPASKALLPAMSCLERMK